MTARVLVSAAGLTVLALIALTAETIAQSPGAPQRAAGSAPPAALGPAASPRKPGPPGKPATVAPRKPESRILPPRVPGAPPATVNPRPPVPGAPPVTANPRPRVPGVPPATANPPRLRPPTGTAEPEINRRTPKRPPAIADPRPPSRPPVITRPSPPRFAAPARPRLAIVPVDAPEMPDEVLVTRRTGATDDELDALATRLGLTVLEHGDVALLGVRITRLLIPDGRTVTQVTAELAAESAVAAAQPNYIYRRQQGKPPTTVPLPQYAIGKLGAEARGNRLSGRGVGIAVVDTGIDATHPDLADLTIDAVDLLGARTHSDLAQEPAHATAIGGIIAAAGKTRGIAPGVRLVSVRAFATFDKSASGKPQRSTSMVVLKALDYAVTAQVKVLNLSFAGPYDALMDGAMAALLQRGVSAVAAAGNFGRDAAPSYPAAYPGVIAVTAVDARDRLYEAASRGRHITVAAPGVDVLAASADHAHELVTGTSFAAAHVSALIALLLEAAPNLSPADLALIVRETAVDLGETGPDADFGAGLANLAAALKHDRLTARRRP